MNKYQMSCCIGFWRSGVDDATIAAILEVDLWEVYSAIKTYKSTLK